MLPKLYITSFDTYLTHRYVQTCSFRGCTLKIRTYKSFKIHCAPCTYRQFYTFYNSNSESLSKTHLNKELMLTSKSSYVENNNILT